MLRSGFVRNGNDRCGGLREMLDMDKDSSVYKEALLRKRGEIYSSGGAVKPLQASMDVNSRQGDLADQASGNN
jgi:hypothetical protein